MVQKISGQVIGGMGAGVGEGQHLLDKCFLGAKRTTNIKMDFY